MRRPPQRLGERFARVIDTDPIDIRDIRRAAPPRPPAVHQPFAGGRRPDLPIQPVRLTVIGAPIPTADVDDPVRQRSPWPSWSSWASRAPAGHGWRARWTPRRRRRATVIALTLGAVVAMLVVALAAASVLRDGPGQTRAGGQPSTGRLLDSSSRPTVDLAHAPASRRSGRETAPKRRPHGV